MPFRRQAKLSFGLRICVSLVTVYTRLKEVSRLSGSVRVRCAAAYRRVSVPGAPGRSGSAVPGEEEEVVAVAAVVRVHRVVLERFHAAPRYLLVLRVKPTTISESNISSGQQSCLV